MTTYDTERFTSPEEQEEWFAVLARTIAFDFDGVLHPYTDGWVGSVPADEPPTPGARELLEKLRTAGFRIVVFSTRCDHGEGLNGTIDWLEKHGLLVLVDEVGCQKPAAIAYVDDRAVPFQGDWEAVEAGIARLAEGRPHGAAEAPLSRFYVTFGQQYAVESHPRQRAVHPDGVTLIEAPDYLAARGICIQVYGTCWSDLQAEEYHDPSYYPRGVTARLRRNPDGSILIEEGIVIDVRRRPEDERSEIFDL